MKIFASNYVALTHLNYVTTEIHHTLSMGPASAQIHSEMSKCRDLNSRCNKTTRDSKTIVTLNRNVAAAQAYTL